MKTTKEIESVYENETTVGSCEVCGAPSELQFCSGICESEYHEVMVAMDELSTDPAVYIEEYAMAYEPKAAAFFNRMDVTIWLEENFFGPLSTVDSLHDDPVIWLDDFAKEFRPIIAAHCIGLNILGDTQ